MFFLVLHRKNLWLNGFRKFLGQETSTFNMDNLDLTAIFNFNQADVNDKLEEYLLKIVAYTQNNSQTAQPFRVDWCLSKRPTEIGDIIQTDDHRIFLIDNSGFKQIKQDPIIHVGQIVFPPFDIPTDPYRDFPSLGKNWESHYILKTMELGRYYREICEHQGQIYHRLGFYK
ncbi:MAG: hypothetical protein QNJ37_17260 [Crocosphaera sp.]|nr:hypothetical protein [Crocosphaera sp.]